MKRHWLLSMAAVMNLAAAGGVLAADEAARASAGSADGALPAEVQEALKEFSSENFKVRQEAMKHLEQAFGRQLRALITSQDPEVQSRVVSLLEFNEGLTRLAINATRLPPAEGKAQLDFVLRADVLPAVAKLISKVPEQRVEGIKALALMKEREAVGLIAPLLDDPSRLVYMAAMEAVYDREPTKAVVDSLWNRAVESGFTAVTRQMEGGNQPVVMFRGRALEGMNYYSLPAGDSKIAMEVLLNCKSPLVDQKVGAFAPAFEDLSTKMPWVSNNEPAQNFFEIASRSRSPEVIKALYRLATGTIRNRGTTSPRGGEKMFWSNRTAPMAALVQATDQKLEDYQLKKSVQTRGGMWCSSSEEVENESVKKLEAWMTANEGKLGKGTTTAPVRVPATRVGSEGAK